MTKNPVQNKMKPQPFSLFLMVFIQTDLKVKQTSADGLHHCQYQRIVNCKYPKSGHVAKNLITAML